VVREVMPEMARGVVAIAAETLAAIAIVAAAWVA